MQGLQIVVNFPFYRFSISFKVFGVVTVLEALRLMFSAWKQLQAC